MRWRLWWTGTIDPSRLQFSKKFRMVQILFMLKLSPHRKTINSIRIVDVALKTAKDAWGEQHSKQPIITEMREEKYNWDYKFSTLFFKCFPQTMILHIVQRLMLVRVVSLMLFLFTMFFSCTCPVMPFFVRCLPFHCYAWFL